MSITNNTGKVFAFKLSLSSQRTTTNAPSPRQSTQLYRHLFSLPLNQICSAYFISVLTTDSPQGISYSGDQFVPDNRPSNMSKRPAPESQPSGLTKILDSTGRTRGSSATPVEYGPPLVSPQPQRDLQKKIENMSSDLRNTSLSQVTANRNNKTSARRGSMLQNASNQGGYYHTQGMSTRSVASSDDQGVKISNHTRGTSVYQTGSNRDLRYNSSMGSGANSFVPKQGASSYSSHDNSRVSSSLTKKLQF